MPMEKEEKVTIRISEADLLEIDQYLEVHQSYGSRSEFIRTAVFDFMNRGIATPMAEGAEVHLDGTTLDTLYKAVERGFFNSINEAISIVLNEASSEGIINNIIKRKIEGKKASEDLFEEYDRRVRPIGSASSMDVKNWKSR